MKLSLNVLQKFMVVFCLGMFVIGCSNDNLQPEKQQTKENEFQNFALSSSENNISEIIATFDSTLEYAMKNNNFNKEELSAYAINEFNDLGILVRFDTLDLPDFEPSQIYTEFVQRLNSPREYESATGYLESLNILESDVRRSDISDLEKELMLTNILFMEAFINWTINVNQEYENETNGWWDDWGKCAASTIGGAITGAIAGCAGLGSLGATVGTAIAPGVGTIVGGAAGCRIGGVTGAIGGALVGAGAGCD